VSLVSKHFRKLFYPFVLFGIVTLIYFAVRSEFQKETIVSMVLFLSLVFSFLGEQLFPYRKNVERGCLKRDLSYTAINIVFISIVGAFVVSSLTSGVRHFTGMNTLFISEQLGPLWLQVIAVIFGVDLFRYFIHRAQHKFGFLWNFHAQHHSIKKTYSMNNFYSHPLDLFFRHAMPGYIFAAVGFEGGAIGAGLSVLGVIGIFSHCDADLNFGFLNKFITTSQVHRWHHASDLGVSGKNYAPSLALWDQVFGTYYFDESSKGPEFMGLGAEEEALHPVDNRWKFTWSPFTKLIKSKLITRN
jgi:sterol desaturase/sphingolipid hydroxylase (fatty acid hydroxylase superfamily)